MRTLRPQVSHEQELRQLCHAARGLLSGLVLADLSPHRGMAWDDLAALVNLRELRVIGPRSQSSTRKVRRPCVHPTHLAAGAFEADHTHTAAARHACAVLLSELCAWCSLVR